MRIFFTFLGLAAALSLSAQSIYDAVSASTVVAVQPPEWPEWVERTEALAPKLELFPPTQPRWECFETMFFLLLPTFNPIAAMPYWPTIATIFGSLTLGLRAWGLLKGGILKILPAP